jgi:hypothetical protein
VSSDSATSTKAVQFLRDAKEIHIVNMSRPLLQARKGSVDSDFGNAFNEMIRSKIVVKALGNAGTDLAGNVSSSRRALGLGPTGDLSAFDGALIEEVLNNLKDDHLVLAQNWKVDGSTVALSATVPGENAAALLRTIGAPADGIFSFATGNFESGSSFAAPQISATLALLMQSQMRRCGSMNLSHLVLAIRNNANLLDAEKALHFVLSNGCG